MKCFPYIWLIAFCESTLFPNQLFCLSQKKLMSHFRNYNIQSQKSDGFNFWWTIGRYWRWVKSKSIQTDSIKPMSTRKILEESKKQAYSNLSTWRILEITGEVRTICARRMTEWWKSISKNECSRPSRSICLLTNPWWRLVGMTDFVSGRVLPGGHRGDPAPVGAILCRIRRRQVGGKRFWQFLKIYSNYKK